jgi:hypothetical protein
MKELITIQECNGQIVNAEELYEKHNIKSLRDALLSNNKAISDRAHEIHNVCSAYKNWYDLENALKSTEWKVYELAPLSGVNVEFDIISISIHPRYKPKALAKEQKTYLMHDSNTGLTKIGKSFEPKIREKTLQSEKPTIQLLHIFDSDIESNLHKKFNHKRVRGEWFELTRKEIDSIISKYDKPQNQ